MLGKFNKKICVCVSLIFLVIALFASLGAKMQYSSIGPEYFQFAANKNLRYLESGTSTSFTFKGSSYIPLKIGEYSVLCDSDITVDRDAALDTGAISGGSNYYVYVCYDTGADHPTFKISLNSTYPNGYDTTNSEKIGGFHTLCANVGDISGHSLSGYATGAILPASIWDLKHRPRSAPEGMVYIEKANIWVDIYLMSDDGASGAQSVFGATILDTINWMDTVDRLAKVKKKLLDDSEFQIAMAGSNEETNIAGSADPVTVTAAVDTAGRLMISNDGVIGGCGIMWQWLRDQSYRFDAPLAHEHTETGSVTATSGTTIEPAWVYYDLPGSKGSLYKQGTYGDIKLRAGGHWAAGTRSGSRSRYADNYRGSASTDIGGRGRSEPL